MNDPQITHADLLVKIGAQAVEIDFLKREIGALQAQLAQRPVEEPGAQDAP